MSTNYFLITYPVIVIVNILQYYSSLLFSHMYIYTDAKLYNWWIYIKVIKIFTMLILFFPLVSSYTFLNKELGKSTNKWTNKMWYTHTIQILFSLNKEEILFHVTANMNFEDTILSKIN